MGRVGGRHGVLVARVTQVRVRQGAARLSHRLVRSGCLHRSAWGDRMVCVPAYVRVGMLSATLGLSPHTAATALKLALASAVDTDGRSYETRDDIHAPARSRCTL